MYLRRTKQKTKIGKASAIDSTDQAAKIDRTLKENEFGWQAELGPITDTKSR